SKHTHRMSRQKHTRRIDLVRRLDCAYNLEGVIDCGTAVAAESSSTVHSCKDPSATLGFAFYQLRIEQAAEVIMLIAECAVQHHHKRSRGRSGVGLRNIYSVGHQCAVR